MTTTKRIFTGAAILVSLAGIVVFLVSCMTPTVSRIPVPGSSMTMVVTADLAGCYDVELFDHG